MRKWVRNVTACTPLLWPPEAAGSSLGKRVIPLLWLPGILGGRLPGIPRDVFPCDPLGRKTQLPR